MVKTAVVTGGSRGIGRGIVLELARLGYRLGIHSRSDGAAAHEAELLAREAGASDVVRFQADIADLDECDRLVGEVFDRLGGCDVWVNNAGIAPEVRADMLEMTAESWDKVVGTNLRGPFFLSQAVARRMMALRGSACADSDEIGWGTVSRPACGHIVFVTSISAEVVSVNRAEYCISKAGLAMAARLFAARLAEVGIVVTEIRPGIVATDMTAGVKSKYDAAIAEGLVPQRRWGLPEDVGRAVAAVARGDLDFATGTVIHVDGGLTIGRL